MSAPVAIFRQPYCQVVIEGIPIQPLAALGDTIIGPNDASVGVLGAHTSYGFDLRVAECTISLTSKPIWLDYNMPVIVKLAARRNAALSQVPRFTGTVVEFDYTLWPHQVDVLCRGSLFFAQMWAMDESIYLPDDPLRATMGGLDLTSRDTTGTPHGTADAGIVIDGKESSIIKYALDAAGVPGAPYPLVDGIGGSGYFFGTVCPENVRWPAGQTALDLIDTYDQVCLGFRTYDTPGGVKRSQVTILPNTVTPWTFTEGVDILSATGSDEVLSAKGTVHVVGATPSGGTAPAFTATAQAASYTKRVDSVSSALLEKSNTADSGVGLSCEAVAQWRLSQVQYPLLKRQFETPRDDAISPGDTVRINAPTRLGTSRTYWVQRVDTDLSEQGVFTQKLTCLAVAA